MLEEGTVEFRNVTFAYPNAQEPILKNINFRVIKVNLLRLLVVLVGENLVF